MARISPYINLFHFTNVTMTSPRQLNYFSDIIASLQKHCLDDFHIAEGHKKNKHYFFPPSDDDGAIFISPPVVPGVR